MSGPPDGSAVVLGVCLGPGGVPKRAVERAAVGALGLAGDGHRFRLHGGPDRAVCILTEEEVLSLAEDGVGTGAPGTFGENLLLGGLDPVLLRPGDRLEVGDEVVLELHDVRAPCRTLRGLDPRLPDLMLGRSGWLCRVVRGGTVAPGMEVRRIPAPVP